MHSFWEFWQEGARLASPRGPAKLKMNGMHCLPPSLIAGFCDPLGRLVLAKVLVRRRQWHTGAHAQDRLCGLAVEGAREAGCAAIPAAQSDGSKMAAESDGKFDRVFKWL